MTSLCLCSHQPWCPPGVGKGGKIKCFDFSSASNWAHRRWVLCRLAVIPAAQRADEKCNLVLEVPEDLRSGESGRARLGWMDTTSQSKKVQRRSYICRAAADSSSELCPVSEAPVRHQEQVTPGFFHLRRWKRQRGQLECWEPTSSCTHHCTP